MWNVLVEAERDMDLYACGPKLIEGGLMSYGNDMRDENTPHERGLGRFYNSCTAIGNGTTGRNVAGRHCEGGVLELNSGLRGQPLKLPEVFLVK